MSLESLAQTAHSKQTKTCDQPVKRQCVLWFIYLYTFSFQCFRKISQMLHTPVPTQHPLLAALLPLRFLMHAWMCQWETTGRKGAQNFQIYVKTVGCNNKEDFLAEETSQAGLGRRNLSLPLLWKARGSCVRTMRLPCPLDPTLRAVSFLLLSLLEQWGVSVFLCLVFRGHV